MDLMKTPRSLDICITGHCNLRCAYCSHFGSAGEVPADLAAGEWLEFFQEVGQAQVLEVCLSGGEPFIREDLRQLIDGIVQNRMRFSLLTNGTLITEEISAYLASTGRCNGLQVSLDGSMPETHDACRREGNFYRAVDGIRQLQEQQLPVTVRVTIHKHNVLDLANVAKLLLEDLGLPGFSTNAASYMGLCQQNAEQIMLSAQDRTCAMETLLSLAEKYPGRISATAGPLAEARQWLEMEQARREGREFLPGKGYLTGCAGPLSKLAVRADGVMVPCTQLSHLELGRINQDDLVEVWQQHPSLVRLRQRHTIPLREFDFCRGCDYLNYCSGNCPALAYTLYGTENHPSPDACLKIFLEAGGRLPQASRLAGIGG